MAESHRFDEAGLAEWMKANVAGFEGPLEVRQFKGGQSNPTYQLVTPDQEVRHAPQAARASCCRRLTPSTGSTG